MVNTKQCNLYSHVYTHGKGFCIYTMNILSSYNNEYDVKIH